MTNESQEPNSELKVENPLSNETPTPEKKPSKFPRWLIAVIVLIGICCVAAFIIVPMIFKVNVSGGGYSSIRTRFFGEEI